MKYTDEEVRTLIVEKHPFKRVYNYFMNFLIYQDPLEAAKDPSPEDSDSGNEADTEPEPEEECFWELNSLATNIDKLDFNNTTNNIDKWYINENLNLAYLSALASDSVPSDTSTDVNNDPLSAIDVMTSFQVLVRSSFIVHEKTRDAQGAFLEVPTKHKSQKPILFENSSLSQWLTKFRRMILIPHNSLTTDKIHTVWWRI